MIADLRAAAAEFAEFDGWKLAAVDAGRGSQHDLHPWELLLARIADAVQASSEARTDILLHRPETSEPPPITVQTVVATEIHQHLSRGGRLGRMSLAFRTNWKQALSVWQVQGRSPETADHILAIQRFLSVQFARTELQPLWDGLMAAHGAPKFTELGEEPERAAHTFAGGVAQALNWWCQTWVPLKQRLEECGLDWDRVLGDQPPDVSAHGEMRRIMSAVRDRLIRELEQTRNHLDAARLKKQTGDILVRLRRNTRPEVNALCTAIQDHDADAYRHAFEQCLAAAERHQHALRRKELLSRLTRRTAGGALIGEQWAESISNRSGIHGESTPPGDVAKAWEWRQLNEELDRRAAVDLEEIGRKIADLQDDIQRVTRDLIERKAWARQIRRTSARPETSALSQLGIRVGGFRRFGDAVGNKEVSHAKEVYCPPDG